ncbi:MAG TPA: transposase, partial [Thermomicrobiales bacterium]|nr:transposase [Thermomicrobiales bacterium]
MDDPTTREPVHPLLPELLALVAAHRPAVRQERVAQRQFGLLLGWLCGFGRHTLTQVLFALGLGQADWTAWYRLFSQARLDDDRLTTCLLGETLGLVAAIDPYLVAVDATQLGRRSQRMPGPSWRRHPGTPV